VDADPWPDAVEVLAFGQRMICTRCRFIGADARPNWKEHARAEPHGCNGVALGAAAIAAVVVTSLWRDIRQRRWIGTGIGRPTRSCD
jgi:hypothetical protein